MFVRVCVFVSQGIETEFFRFVQDICLNLVRFWSLFKDNQAQHDLLKVTADRHSCSKANGRHQRSVDEGWPQLN